MKIFVFLVEPAEYTLDLIENIYKPRGISWCFLRKKSLAAPRCVSGMGCLEGWAFLKKVKYIVDILKRNDFIVINGYMSAEFLILFAVNFFFYKPIAIESDTPLRVPGQWAARFLKWIYLSIVFRNPCVFGWAGGNFAHKKLFSHYGMKPEHIHLMPMMIDVSRYLREDLCASCLTSSFHFLYLGRLVDIKGIDILIRAFLRLVNEHEAVSLDIVGSGPLESEFKNKLKGERRVVFHGALFGDAKIRMLWDCQALVLPSTQEPWGLVVNEAMAAGLPVIVSDAVGACRDLVAGSGAGFVFQSGDEDALLDCMRNMISNKERYQEQAMKARQYMTNIWNYDLYARCFDNATVSTVA